VSAVRFRRRHAATVMLSGAKHLCLGLWCFGLKGSEILRFAQDETYEMVCTCREQMKYDWKEAGEEWSAPWGSSAAQWTGSIFPRIRDFLPTGTILEIAPGFGRWTHYLKDYCEELWAVDKSSECTDACRERFAAEPHVHCCLNDGRSLAMVPDASVDFVFSFDSFVNTGRVIVVAYIREM
jgi:SAM-dependent methyltransferase